MKLGKLKIFLIIFYLFFLIDFSSVADDKIETVPLINLEDLSPTFEEGKDELEKEDSKKESLNKNKKVSILKENKKNNKIYANIKALDKITAKTSSIKLALGEKRLFGPLEIKVLKCQFSTNENNLDTVAYIQVKDLSTKDNDQVFLFNGWTFSSSPTLRSIDHPVYDLWITSCDNI